MGETAWLCMTGTQGSLNTHDILLTIKCLMRQDLGIFRKYGITMAFLHSQSGITSAGLDRIIAYSLESINKITIQEGVGDLALEFPAGEWGVQALAHHRTFIELPIVVGIYYGDIGRAAYG